MGDYPSRQAWTSLELTDQIFSSALQEAVLQDEVYCQILKQLTHNTKRSVGSREGWKAQWAQGCCAWGPLGPPYPLPQLPLTPGWSQPCLLPSRHPFYDGEGWFSPNPADTSPLCLSLTLPPREAPRWPPEMSQQDGAPATHAASQMGPKRGSGSPTVTRHAVSSGPRVSSS